MGNSGVAAPSTIDRTEGTFCLPDDGAIFDDRKRAAVDSLLGKYETRAIRVECNCGFRGSHLGYAPMEHGWSANADQWVVAVWSSCSRCDCSVCGFRRQEFF